MPNFIEISQTSLAKNVTKIGPRTQKNYFVRNVTTRVARARGATKKWKKSNEKTTEVRRGGQKKRSEGKLVRV